MLWPGSQFDHTVAWFEYTGSVLNPWAKRILTTLADGASSVVVTDMDDDGDMDVISAAQDGGTVEWYDNNGGGGFSTHVIRSELDGVIDVFAADMDGDGDTDVVAAVQHEGRIVVYENNGSEEFQEQPVYSDLEEISRPLSVFVSDINGDGALDILSANLGLDMIGLYKKRAEIALGNPDITIKGVDAFDGSGNSVSSAGDVNGDGFDDLLIGASRADLDGVTGAGESYTVFGGSSFGQVSLASLGSNGMVIRGVGAGDHSGGSVSSAGDVNGDGFDDLLIGAWGADQKRGESYVIFGSSSPGPVVNLANLGSDGITIKGTHVDDFSGGSVSSAGDVNGDGFDDLLIGASGANPAGVESAGESYLVLGSAFPALEVNLASLGSNGIVIRGVGKGDHSGGSVSSAGDVNGDGFDDLLIGAWGASPGGNDGAGESYLVLGSAFPALEVNLASLGSNGTVIRGVGAGDHSGGSVSSAGDVNGDGFDDLLIGAWGASPGGNDGAGESYVVFGNTSPGPEVNLASLGSNGMTIRGIDAGDSSGRSVSSAGDVNGDGFDDLLIGASTANPGISGAGDSYVVFGSASPGSAVNLASLGNNGITTKGIAGRSVSSAGDVNGDGFDDLLIGAKDVDSGGVGGAGESHVYFGRDFSGVVTHGGSDGPNTLTGTSAANVMIGGRGDDALSGRGGADVLRGGAGDDTLSVSDLDFRKIVGGNGEDTLQIDHISAFDFANIPDNRILGIERIDTQDGVPNLLKLNRLEVLNISDESNRLVILHEANDTVDLGSGWSQSGTEVVDGQTFTVWTQGQARVLLSGGPTNSGPSVDNQTFQTSENSTNGTLVGIVSATDPNAGDTLTYAITGGSGNGIFDINSGNGRISVVSGGQLNFEAVTSYSLNVRVTDSGGEFDTAVMTVNVTNVNEAPSLGDQAFNMPGSSNNGAVVGTLVGSDPDVGDSLSYQIISGNVLGVFAVNTATGLITVANAGQLGIQSPWQLTVRATDSGGLSDTATTTVNVIDQNQSPTVSNQTFSIAENSVNGTPLGIVSASDPDAGDVLTFSITGGSGNGIFTVNSDTGQITVANQGQLDFETAQSYGLNLRVTDSGGLSDMGVVTVNVTNVNEPPEIANQSFSVLESAGNGAFVGLIAASDPDLGDTLSFQITAGNPGNAMGIGANSGVVTVTNASQLGNQQQWQLSVRATDSSGLSKRSPSP